MTEIQDAVERLIAKHGTLRAAARAVKFDPAYLCRLRYGKKRNPSPDVLKKLGLKRTITLERLI